MLKPLPLLAAWMTLIALCAPVVSAQATDPPLNFRSFEVNAPEAAAYYAEFWLIPARNADNTYTTFRVFVNGEPVGVITPTEGNWQTARIDDNPTLDLRKGANVISVATPDPEVPEVEKIKLSLSDIDASISSEAYDKYFSDALSERVFEDTTQESIAPYAFDSDLFPFGYMSTPLKYSFHTIASFTAGETVTISTESLTDHLIDVKFYGIPKKPEIVIPPIINPFKAERLVIDTPKIDSLSYQKIGYAIEPLTIEQNQTLNWMNRAERRGNSGTKKGKIQFRVPITGYYQVRLRTAENLASGVASLNINGKVYENVPMCSNVMSWHIAANGCRYRIHAYGNGTGDEDPLLFVHGADGDRIVAFDDDSGAKRDAIIESLFLVPVTAISISSYSSSDPESTCMVMANRLDNPNEAGGSIMKSSHSNDCTTANSAIINSVDAIHIPAAASLDGSIAINSGSHISSVAAFTLSGNCTGTATCSGNSIEIPVSVLNIRQPGIYIVSVTASGGVESSKLIVK